MNEETITAETQNPLTSKTQTKEYLASTDSDDESEDGRLSRRQSMNVENPKSLFPDNPDWFAKYIINVNNPNDPDGFDSSKPLGPQMYQWEYLGLYAHYAGVGLCYGIQGLCLNFCYYYFGGENNVCANAPSMIFIPWGFKIFYAMACDSFRPYGMRRKPYMIIGWIGVLLLTLLLAFISDVIDTRTWIGISILIQGFLMLADVPADGYSVEMGQLENENERGQILATGQRIRFFCGIFAGLIQAVLVNGTETNKSGCEISASQCWAFGFTPNQYYGVVFALLFILCIPIYWLKEPSAKDIPYHDFQHHKKDLWDTMTNSTTLYLLIFVVGNGAFSIMQSQTQTYVQYEIIGLTNFQSGIMTILTNFATMAGIICFQKYFINWNWRYTQYISVLGSAILSLLWLFVYYDTGMLLPLIPYSNIISSNPKSSLKYTNGIILSLYHSIILSFHNLIALGGTMDAWFTIFLQLNVALTQGLGQVLFAMAVIELAKKGQESTTYELIISTANSASNISFVIATQILSLVNANTCDNDDGTCPDQEVNLSSKAAYQTTDGPNKFTDYTFMIFAINIIGMIIFTPFLPKQKKECEEWRDQGNSFVNSPNPIIAFFTPERVGWTSTIIAVITISYQILSAIMLLNPNTSCLQAFGGSGC